MFNVLPFLVGIKMSFLLCWMVDGGETTGAFFKRMPQIELGGDARIMEEERCDSEARTLRTISICKITEERIVQVYLYNKRIKEIIRIILIIGVDF